MSQTSHFRMENCIYKKALCVSGGGLRAMTGASSFLSIALAADMKFSTEKNALEVDDINGILYKLMSTFEIVTSTSGGSWFVYSLLTSTPFNEILGKLALRYIEKEFSDTSSVCVLEKDENPLIISFLRKSLNLVEHWNEEYLEKERTRLGKGLGYVEDKLAKKFPKFGGDLYLPMKFAFHQRNI